MLQRESFTKAVRPDIIYFIAPDSSGDFYVGCWLNVCTKAAAGLGFLLYHSSYKPQTGQKKNPIQSTLTFTLCISRLLAAWV
jgi:hypothetical protein